MARVAYRPEVTWRSRSLFGALGLRPATIQHSHAEGALLRRCAEGRGLIVEIGVAEGGSAWESRQAMPDDGRLVLIDPYFLAKGPISPAKLVARRLVGSVPRGRVEWLEQFSHDAVKGWRDPIDFLFIDGDHSYDGVRRDWEEWTPHLATDSLVALHDAHPDGPWTQPQHGPVRLFNDIAADSAWALVDHADSLAVFKRAFY